MITHTSPILSLLFAKGLGARTLSKVIDQAIEEGVPIDEVAELSVDRLVSLYGLRRDIAESVHAARDQAERTAEELARNDIEVLVRGVAPYPPRLSAVLADKAPPLLFALGCTALSERQAVGFCGSRKASGKGIQVASRTASELARNNINVVSGYAKGVDLAAHRAALEAAGSTTIVLAEGILHFRQKSEVKSLLSEGNYLVVSEFLPSLPWSGRNAMQRNSTIIGLSDAVVCIEAGMTGGTHAAAESTLAYGLPLFVADFANPAESASGNKHFLARGAVPLRGDREGVPQLQRIYETLSLREPSAGNSAANATACRTSVDETSDQAANWKDPMNDASSERGHRYPKRLIEVDLPIARISAHARREKSIRHGHISTLHIWWARRPLAACRAVICAALWPDPADPLCPPAFREAAVLEITAFAKRVFPERLTEEGKLLSSEKHLSPESRGRWEAIAGGTLTLDAAEESDWDILRFCLLDFIADFANWDNSTVPAYLETSRALTQAAHEAIGGIPGTRPLVADPFAGGGAIPLEALRVGADAFASDLNPVAVLLNKVVLEYIPKYGDRLGKEVRKWGQKVKEALHRELDSIYPRDPNGATPIGYLWARTIQCEGPGCGTTVPMMRSLWLAKKAKRPIALKVQAVPSEKRVSFEVTRDVKTSDALPGTAARGSVTCPCCGYTTPVTSVRIQLASRKGGASDPQLIAVAVTEENQRGRTYRLPTKHDYEAVIRAQEQLRSRRADLADPPTEGFSGVEPRRIPVPQYGITEFQHLFLPRQLFSLLTIVDAIKSIADDNFDSPELAAVVRTMLALSLGKHADLANSLCAWEPIAECPRHLFGKQAINMVWDFAEGVTTGESSGSWSVQIERMAHILESIGMDWGVGTVVQSSATQHPLPDDSADCLITDPPYYYSVPYSDLSDFFYVWLKRALSKDLPDLFSTDVTPKDDECVQNLPHAAVKHLQKDRRFYEQSMCRALSEGLRFTKSQGVATVVFAHSSTDAWESLLEALIQAGWQVTASWPLDTEMGSRIVAQRQRTLASSIHLVCRPRVRPGLDEEPSTGEWRDVLSELPRRIHEWMPRLAAEGVVGADAIFACLGPALEIFSRYSRVEKASGEEATLREYLEHVWAAVSTEALSVIFRDADAAGLEPDARLTAMWLWTLGAGSGKPANGNGDSSDDSERVTASTGYTLEFDAARKIAQGLGVHLEKSESIVEVKGDNARLLPVSERTKHLFGKDTQSGPSGVRKKKAKQQTFFDELDEAEAAEAGWTDLKGPPPGSTVLDRLHQTMILFAAGRGELMKRFLVEEGVGQDARFWKLAQSLSALYPVGTDEKRWVDGVLARKKGLGL